MPTVEFQEPSTGSVKLSGQEQSGVSGSRGPNAFPPSPPKPVHLVAVKVWDADPTYLSFTFDQPVYMDEHAPLFTCTEKPAYAPGQLSEYGDLGYVKICSALNPANAPVAGNHLVVPANCPGWRSLSGGYITPGSYVIAPA
jgi:hypothetical protein